jgi:hypothetical protein
MEREIEILVKKNGEVVERSIIKLNTLSSSSEYLHRKVHDAAEDVVTDIWIKEGEYCAAESKT